MSKIIGIDLGTTNSCVAVIEGGEPVVIPNSEGANTTPSVVAFKNHEVLVGIAAKRQAVTNPKNTIFSAKRFIGHRYEEVKEDAKHMPFEVKEKQGRAVIVADGTDMFPQEISAKVLMKLKVDAEAFLGQKVTKAVITVPAYFDDNQRQATKEAGEIAGLEVVRIINEPTAATLAYGLDKKKEEKVIVYDLGGGTFDVTVLEISGDGHFEVLATNGDTRLGGDDFDQEILKWLLAEFKKDQGVDLSSDKIAIQRVREAAEKAKIELSSQTETEINLPFITADNTGPKHMTIKLSRAKLESLVAELIGRTTKPCEEALKDAGVSKSDINEVVLVGGMTRMPAVHAKVKELFGKEPHKGVNPDEVVAIGAAIQAGQIGGDINRDITIVDVIPLSVGIETLGGVATKLIDKNSRIPTSKSQVFSTAADSQTSVEINVVQGEREMAADNRSLGRFVLDGILAAPRGLPQIEVKFDIDTNGLLSVKAKDLGTGKEQHISIQGSTGLSKEEVEKMKKDAEVNADADKKKRELIDAKNQADALIFSLEKQIRENDKIIPDDLKKKVNEKMNVLRDVLKKEGASTDEIKKATEEMGLAAQEIGKMVYEEAQKKQQSQASPEDKKKGDDVVDAEVVDEKK